MKHLLITGAAQRLGLHCAQTLAEQGYQVTITYRTQHDSLKKLEQQGVQCLFADFSTDQGIRDFIQLTKQQCSNLNAIIHNASSWHSDSLEQPESVFDAMMQVHAKAPYLINLALQAHFNETLENIIHVSDFVAEVGSEKHIAYAASKAAMDNLTRSLARKWAPKIRVNSIAPSMIIFNDSDDEEYRQKALQKSLLGVEAGAETFTQTVLYLLTNHYITGQVIALNGGRNLKLP